MVDAIVYSSCTGSCQKYAQKISEATGIPAYSVKSFDKKKPRQEVVYIGWLLGGFVMGLGKARKKARVRAVCQVGMGPDKAGLEGIARKKNHIKKNVPVMYMQGSFNLKKLPLPMRLIMKKKIKSIAAGLESKAAIAPLSPQEAATYKMATTGAGEPASWDVARVTDWLNR